MISQLSVLTMTAHFDVAVTATQSEPELVRGWFTSKETYNRLNWYVKGPGLLGSW